MTQPGASTSPVSTPTSSSKKKSGFALWIIAVIVVGVMVVIGAMVAIVIYLKHAHAAKISSSGSSEYQLMTGDSTL